MSGSSAGASCLSVEHLERLNSEGAIPEPLRRHLAECPNCAGAARRLRENSEFVRGYLGDAAPVGGPRPTPSAPPRIEGYQILEELHRGGQGVVYRALHEATRREVALKTLIGGEQASARQRQRFEREVELVAGLRHPGIVTLYDSGLAGDGRQFLAMERIRGQRLGDFVRQRYPAVDRRAVPEILALFVQICAATSHAHQRGVLHRDLKPSNILVDDAGAPHLLDFGVAKAIGASGANGQTRTAEFVGTLAYASPEQVSGSAERVDTRTDVYAIGVMLFEALTGRLPLELGSSLSQAVSAISGAPPADPSALNPVIGDELATILRKALAKEPERRYSSADALQRDLSSYLAGQPIDAKRDSNGYLLRKALRRNRVTVGVAGGFVALLAAYALTMGMMVQRAVRSERLAEARRVEAERSAEIATQVNGFVRGMITSIAPEVALGRDTTLLKSVMEKLEQRVDADETLAPPVEAALRELLADTYLSLGVPARAEAQAERCVELRPGEADPLAEASFLLAKARERQGQEFALVEPLFREALESRRRAGESARAGLAAVLADYGYALNVQGRLEESEDMTREALAIRQSLPGDQSGSLATLLHNLGTLRSDQGRLDEAADFLRQSLAYSQDDPRMTAKTQSDLAGVLVLLGQPDAGETLLREALQTLRRLTSGPHEDIASALNSLAYLLASRGELDQAEAHYRESLAMWIAVGRETSPEVAIEYNNLGALLEQRGDLPEAERHYARAVALLERTVEDPRHFMLANARSRLGGCIARQGRYEEGLALCEPAYAALAEARGAADPLTNNAARRIMSAYEAWGRPERAAEWRARLPESEPAP